MSNLYSLCASLAFGKWWRWESFESVVKFAAENEMNPKARAADEVLVV
jgi:hypothetical protein